MASFTQFRGLGMRRGFIRPDADTIVAARAVAGLPGHRAVIKQDLQPVGGVMADVTSLGSRYVSGALADGYSALMTVLAGIRGLGMIKRHYHRYPHCGGMATLA